MDHPTQPTNHLGQVPVPLVEASTPIKEDTHLQVSPPKTMATCRCQAALVVTKIKARLEAGANRQDRASLGLVPTMALTLAHPTILVATKLRLRSCTARSLSGQFIPGPQMVSVSPCVVGFSHGPHSSQIVFSSSPSSTWMWFIMAASASLLRFAQKSIAGFCSRGFESSFYIWSWGAVLSRPLS